MTEHHRAKAPKFAVVCNADTPLTDLEADTCDLHRMVQLAAMAALDENDELTRFGVFQVEQMTEALKRRFYDLFEKHVGRQSA